MKHNGYEITKLDVSGVLAHYGIQEGDVILSVNQRPFWDDLDALFAEAESHLVLEIQKANGKVETLVIEKGAYEPLGLPCDGSTLGIRRCTNQCIFCFIDQMPPGLRETLYVKDDDERLSFLQGNYITLTNLDAAMKQRIIDYHLMPLNVSVHTTDPARRCQMLHNRFAGTIMDDLRHFADHNILMNAQIVLCPGYNDGAVLKKTLEDLCTLYPALETVSVVPVGLTDYRTDLPVIQPVDQTIARETLNVITQIQNNMMAVHETRFVFPGDELLLSADVPIPKAEYYESFTQWENGVGMLADFEDALTWALPESPLTFGRRCQIGIISGALAAPFMRKCSEKLSEKVPEAQIEVIAIVNHFFGEQITVSGLITGQDLIDQASEVTKARKCNYDIVLIPENMVKYKSNLFLDDITVEKVAAALNVRIKIVPVDGGDFVQTVVDLLRSK